MTDSHVRIDWRYVNDPDGKDLETTVNNSGGTPDWTSVTNKPTFSPVATSGSYNDLTSKPTLAPVATSGAFTDLNNKPTIPASLPDLSDNPTHRTVTDDQIANWDAKGTGTVKSVNNMLPDANGNVTIPVNTFNGGPSANRPASPAIYTSYFDTTIGKPIWYKGANTWVDATGATVAAVVDTTPPNDVTGLATGTITSTSIVLNWTNSISGDVANYEIASTTDGTTYTILSTLGTAGATYTATGLTPSTNYTFRVIAIDTVGNRSAGVTITTATIAGLPVPTVSDDFNRADNTTSVGTSDSYNGGTNKAWTSFGSGGMGISTNRMYAPTGTGQAWVDSGLTDARMEVTITTVGNGHNFFFRVDSNGRYYRYAYNASGWYLQEQNASFTTVATITGGPVLKAGDVVAIEVQGTACRLYVNGTLVHSGTLADLLTNTGFGIGFSSTPLGYADNVNIYALSSAGGGTGGTTPSTSAYTKPTSYLSVKDYGATGNGSTDDTTAIQNCINAANTQGVSVVFPAGTYMINLSKGLAIPSNMTVWGDQNAIIKGITSSLTSYQMLRLWSVSNVNIIGYLQIIGDKAARPAGTASEGGMGISLANASNVNIDGVQVSQCMGDGVYLGDYSSTGNPYNKTIKITNSTFDSCNRNAISVISAIDLTVDTCTFSNSGGNPAGPGAGVDFEPNKATQYQQNLNFNNCKFINNVGHGVWGDLYYMNTSGHPISVTVTNSTVSGNQGNIYGTPGVQSQIASRSTLAGYVKVNGTFIYNK